MNVTFAVPSAFIILVAPRCCCWNMKSRPPTDKVQLRVDAIALKRADAMFRRASYLEKPTFPARSDFEALVARFRPQPPARSA
ncbi:hypothetical protein [Paracoccus sediminilitoris]|uniref:hypothetical protein n=1 Tax=Paracoccus sediminilitoris TaxID=2202419 RepID=UPI0011B94147|nr:hypothetical protein [Paracoccus sediminilitoris]